MPYIIVKSSRGGTSPYIGPACVSASVEPGKMYADKTSAYADVKKLETVNPVGFDVVEVLTLNQLADRYPQIAITVDRELLDIQIPDTADRSTICRLLNDLPLIPGILSFAIGWKGRSFFLVGEIQLTAFSLGFQFACDTPQIFSPLQNHETTATFFQ